MKRKGAVMRLAWVQSIVRERCAALRRGGVAGVLVFLVLGVAGCATSKPTLVVLVGGAGLSQLGDLGEMISATCPDADVIETGGWDGFRADLKSIVRDHPSQGLVLVGHSFGCETIAGAAAGISFVDLVVMIDPAWDDITLPGSIRSCLWYQRADEDLERRAVIRNGGRPIIVAGGHDDICHSPQLIAEVAGAIRNISERNAFRERLRERLAPGR